MVTQLERFQRTLRQLFMLDQADLDFGIYRIMNQKRNDIDRYLNTLLPRQVKAVLAENRAADTATKQKELDDMIASLRKMGVEPDTVPAVVHLKAEIAAAGTMEDLENTVYSHLTTFFARYYDSGDFVSLRRYKKDAYAIPYEGEEVKLHWANADQYYIKTDEYFRNYSFTLSDGKRVEFTLREASTEQNDNLSQNNLERRFALYEDEPISIDGDTLHINFTYDLYPKTTKQKELIGKAYRTLSDIIPSEFHSVFVLRPSDKDASRTLLQKHLNDYVARNTFDYFIHKDLKGFLSRELDFYIKNEVFEIDDINARSTDEYLKHLSVIKALKRVGASLIQFLTQLEEFQKRLWLKKKFVVQADYCITLDRVPQSLYDEICANDRQREEWVRLFAINEIEQDIMHPTGYSVPLKKGFLVDNPYLVLDTALFSTDFKHHLLSLIENFDEQCNGVLIKSDNFHALKLIGEKYKGIIDSVYIDPPYNTGSDGFLYKDNYLHSSWLSMMKACLSNAKLLMAPDSSIAMSINENELFNLKELSDTLFCKYLTTIAVKVRHDDRILKGDKDFHEVYENVLFYSPSSSFKPSKRTKDNTSTDEYVYSITTGTPDEIIELGNKSVEVYNPGNYTIVKAAESAANLLKRISVRGSIREGNSSGRFYVSFLENRTPLHPGCLYKVPNIGDDGLGYRFFWTPTMESGRKNGDYFQGKPISGKDTLEIPYPNMLDMVTDFNDATDEGGVPYRNGKKPIKFLTHILSLQKVPLNKDAIVLDFFAGSSSTGHAVVNLNRQDKGNRKYVLVQLGEIFDFISKIRMMKVVYSKDWVNGKPISREGLSHCFKYLRLEQYEDTLNNLTFNPPTNEVSGEFFNGFLLGYMLDVETRDSLFNLKWFVNPFDMKLLITKGNKTAEENIDLPETFNYLIGLNISSMSWPMEGIQLIEGVTRKGKRTLVIWRDCNRVDNEALNNFFVESGLKNCSKDFDTIYINGDNLLANTLSENEASKVMLIEPEFNKQMFKN